MMEIFKESRLGRIEMDTRSAKPVFIAGVSTTDPAVLAFAEMLFWTDIEADHAGYMTRFFPSELLPGLHDQALAFRNAFERIHGRCRKLEPDPDEVGGFIKYEALPWAEAFLKFKLDVERRQKTGEIRSLNWPSFLSHIVRENGRFVYRLGRYLKGEVEFSRDEVVDFWAPVMSEHLSAMAHQLDPEEISFFERMMEESRRIGLVRKNPGEAGDEEPLAGPVERVIDFKSEAAQKIDSYEVASMIAPGLAEHALREAILFKAELLRADAMLRAGREAA